MVGLQFLDLPIGVRIPVSQFNSQRLDVGKNSGIQLLTYIPLNL
jgi:hypothetical protein